MTPQQWQRAKDYFHRSLDLPEAERLPWLRQQLGAEPEMLAIVLPMLKAESAPSFELPALPLSLDMVFNPDWPSGKRIGSYQIVEKLGSGGVGEVYLAERADGIASNRVAIKRLQRFVHPELAKRFLAERRILSELEHPNIARFLDAGADQERDPYAVIEFLPGLSITRHAQQANLTINQRLTLFLKVAGGVSHAHQRLVVHRDIKPANILLDAQGEPKLLDFGIAKVLAADPAAAEPKTAYEFRAYSPGYAAPEQLRNEDSGTACDIYALGALLYELLSDQPAFDVAERSSAEIERLVLQDLPLAPSRRAPAAFAALDRQTRLDLDNIVLHALKKRPQERYRSVEALANDVQRALHREPISLLQDHRWYRLRRFAGRHALAISLGSAAFLTLLIGVIALYLQGQRVAAERDRAEAARIEAQFAVGLLTRAFSAADPSRNEGNDVSARQVLDLATLDLRQSKLSARLRAVLLIQLADVYRSLGDPSQALALLDDSPVAAEDVEAQTRAALQRQRAEAAIDLNQLSAAQGFLDSSEKALQAQVGNDEEMARSRVQLTLVRARLQVAAGERGVGASTLASAYQQSVQRFGIADQLTQTAALSYADELEAIGRWQEALPINVQVLQAYTEPELSPTGRRVLSNLARIYEDSGELELALQMATRYLSATRTLYGEKHRAYASALNLYARRAAAVGHLGEAKAAYEQTLRVLNELGDRVNDGIRAMANNNFALFLGDSMDDNSAALEYSDRALDFAQRAFSPRHPNLAVMLMVKSKYLLRADRAAEALDLLLRAESIMDEVTTPEMSGATLAQMRLMLTEVNHALGRDDNARNWLAKTKQAALEDQELKERARALDALLQNAKNRH